MTRFTKKYMTEDYERLYDHASLLDLYLWDTQNGAKPDATEHYRDKNGDAKVQLWRGTALEWLFSTLAEFFENCRQRVAICPNCGQNRYTGKACI